MSLNNIESANGYLEALEDGGTAESLVMTQDIPGSAFSRIKDIVATFEHKNKSISTQADLLETTEDIPIGSEISIRLDDDTFHNIILDSHNPRSILDSTNPFGDGSLGSKYKLDDDLTDVLGGPNITGVFAGYVPGKFGNAAHLFLDGSIYYLKVPNQRARSFGVWLYRTNTGASYDRYVFYGINSAENCSLMFSANTDILTWTDAYNVKIDGQPWAIDQSIGFDVWRHLYFEGDSYADYSSMLFGNNAIDSNRRVMGGYIDQIEIYKRPLSNDELAQVIAEQSGIFFDTTSVTAGETPDKVYVVNDKISINTDAGYINANKTEDIFNINSEIGVTLVGSARATRSNPTKFLSDAIAGAQAGDLAIVLGSADSTLSAAVDGWTRIEIGTAGVVATIYHKILTSSDVTFANTAGNPAAIMAVFRGTSTITPVYASASGSIALPNPPALTGFNIGDLVLAAGFVDDDKTALLPPEGYDMIAYNTESGWGSIVGLAMKRSELGGTEDPGLFGGSADDYWYGVTLRLEVNGTIELLDTTSNFDDTSITGLNASTKVEIAGKGTKMIDLSYDLYHSTV